MATTDGAAEPAQRARDTRDAGTRAAEAARKLQNARENMQRLAGEIAATEMHLADTLRHAAAAAERRGRQADADRLTQEAEQAEQYAEVERRRADGE
jgi:hypothetical protein